MVYHRWLICCICCPKVARGGETWSQFLAAQISNKVAIKLPSARNLYRLKRCGRGTCSPGKIWTNVNLRKCLEIHVELSSSQSCESIILVMCRLKHICFLYHIGTLAYFGFVLRFSDHDSIKISPPEHSKMCKPSTFSSICITVSNFANPSAVYINRENTKNVFHCLR